jgi:phenylpropionate dioxygenase-like ring-hydroxylating dioxygenase large terminal subunit
VEYLPKDGVMSVLTQPLRSPADENTGPPKEWFLGDEWFARDIDAVFRPRWLLAGHLDEISAPGAYLTYSLASEEVFIRRDSEGVIRAYHNVCAHRGARLCFEKKGIMGKRIVCPYHGWSYSPSDGALLAAPHMHEDFDRLPWRLRAVHVDVWFGLIFVCLAEERPAPMADYIGDAQPGGYDLAGLKLASVKTHVVEANWKIVIENNLECYHCPIHHPELVAVRDWTLNATNDFDADVKLRAAGLEVIGREVASNHAVKGHKICTIRLPRRDGNSTPHAYGLMWEPGLAMSLSPEYGWIFAPKPIGPARTELKQYWFVSNEAREGRDYEIARLQEFWDITMQQDRLICENVQKGMEMRAFTPGPLNRIYQSGQAGFYAWYMEQMRQRFPEKVHLPERAAAGVTHSSDETANLDQRCGGE